MFQTDHCTTSYIEFGDMVNYLLRKNEPTDNEIAFDADLDNIYIALFIVVSGNERQTQY